MFNRSHLFRIFVSAIAVAAFGISAFADTIRLKDGSIIKGRIVTFAGGRFTIVMGEGSRKREMTFDSAEVESIQFDSQPPERASAPVETRTTSTAAKPRVVTRDSTTASNQPAKTEVPPARTAPAQPQPAPIRRTSSAKPVELSVKVLADNTANGWTNSGWVVKKGQKIRISGEGEVSIGNGKKVSPSGAYDIEDSDKLLKNVPTGALLAVIGDDNNDFIYIGSDREFTAERDGTLFLGINEGNLNDNAGSFNVKIEVTPEGGE